MVIFLSGCIMIPRYKHYDIDLENTSTIEIYDLRNNESHDSDFLETEAPVYIIEKEQMEDFLNDLCDIQFTDIIIITIAAIDPSFYYDDWVVRINYTNGSYSLISCGGYGETYNENNQVTNKNHYSCDEDEWEEFIGKYVPEDIFGNQE